MNLSRCKPLRKGRAYTREQLDAQLKLAQSGIESLIVAQRKLVELS